MAACRYVVLLAGSVMAACTRSTAPAPLMSGSFALQKYNTRSLPVDIGILPPKGQNPGGCHILVTSGSLIVSVESGTFSYSYEVQNACDRSVLSRPGAQGRFEADGNTLTFVLQRVDGELRFRGVIGRGTIEVRLDDETLTFAR